jgi:DegV family protein with EDD domain
MKKVAVITDSSAYLPPEIVEELDLKVLPLTLHWDNDSYRDGVDIKAEDFYGRLVSSNTIPTTSQTTVAEFSDIYKKLLDEDYAVIAILISSGISGTVESALQAKAEFPDAPIEVIDSKLCSMALGFMVMAVARAAKAGASLAECKALAESLFPKIGVYFTVDTLKFLNKGGRINTAKRLVGSALNIKPIMYMNEGKLVLLESVRSRKKAMNRLIELVEKDLVGAESVRISTFHAASDEDCQALMDEAVEKFRPVETVITYVSPVVGTHSGPGTLAIAYMID